jgi:hypothetical protein
MLNNAAMLRIDCRTYVAPSWVNSKPFNTQEKKIQQPDFLFIISHLSAHIFTCT